MRGGPPLPRAAGRRDGAAAAGDGAHRAVARADLADAAVRRGPHRRLPPDGPAAANLRAHASGVGAARAVPEGPFAPPDVLLATTGDDAPTSAEGAPAGGGGGAFGAEASVVLPPDALVRLRLPYVYCEPSSGAALLTAATAAEPAHARRAVLEAGWLQVGMATPPRYAESRHLRVLLRYGPAWLTRWKHHACAWRAKRAPARAALRSVCDTSTSQRPKLRRHHQQPQVFRQNGCATPRASASACCRLPREAVVFGTANTCVYRHSPYLVDALGGLEFVNRTYCEPMRLAGWDIVRARARATPTTRTSSARRRATACS